MRSPVLLSVLLAGLCSACGAASTSPSSSPASPSETVSSPAKPTAPASAVGSAAKPTAAEGPAASAKAEPSVSVSGEGGTAGRKLSIGSVTSPAVLLPLFYARDNGLFQKFGIEPAIQVIQGGSVPLGAALSGEIQILSISAEGIPADLNGADFVYIYSPLPSPPFSIYAKPDVKEVSQLRGRTVGVTALNSSSEAMAKFAAQQAGLKPGEMKIVNTGSPPNSLAALISGQVDAAVFSPPANFQAEAKGFHEVFNGVSSGFRYLATSSMVRKSYGDRNRELVLSYVRTMIAAEAAITKDRAGAMKSLATVARTEDPTTLKGTYDYYAPLFSKYRVPAPSIESVRAALNDFAATVPAARDADPGRFIDDSFVKELETSGFIKQAFGS